MTAIATLTICLVLISTTLAKPPEFLSYQDSRTGQYSFGYSAPTSARSEYRSSDGITRGAYSYIDDNGLIQTTEYEAGDNLGFRVRATNLPQAPVPIQIPTENYPEITVEAEKEKLEMESLPVEEDEDDSAVVVEARASQMKLDKTKSDKVASMILTRAGEHVSSVGVRENSQPTPRVPPYIEGQVHSLDGVVHTAPIRITGNDYPTKPMTNQAQIKSTDFLMQTPSQQQIINVVSQQVPQYTPEVIAARNAHFKAYENAARLAAQSDANPHLLMQAQPTGISNAGAMNPIFQNHERLLQNHKVRIPVLNDNTLNEGGQLNLNLPIQRQLLRNQGANIPVFNNNNLESIGEINIQVYNDGKIKNDSEQKKENKSKQENKIVTSNASQEQLFRSHTVHIPVNQINGIMQPVTRVNQNLPQVQQIPSLVPIISTTDTTLENTESMNEDDPTNKIQSMDVNSDTPQSKKTFKYNEIPQVNPIRSTGLTPAGTSLSFANLRLSTEYEQFLLKAGRYSAPIEFSHYSQANNFPNFLLTQHANPAFYYTYN